MRALLGSFWFWFFGFIFLFSTYDYIKHLMYDDSIFLEYAFQWFLFTACSTLTFSGIIYGTYYLINRFLKLNHFAFDGIGVALSIIVHINFTGPLFNQLFWHQGTLNFFFKWTPLFIILGAFYIIRIGFYFLVERRMRKSEPAI